jgi:hypothetical protein
MTMLLLLRIGPASIVICGARRIHTTFIGNAWTRTVTTVISLTAFANRMLKALRHITQASLTQVLQRFANVGLTIRRGRRLLMISGSILPTLGTRTAVVSMIAIRTTSMFTMLKVGLGIGPRHGRRRSVLGTIWAGTRTRLLRGK